MRDVKIFYKHSDLIDTEFEDHLDDFMLGFGLERWASGFDLCEKVRDIAYDKPQQVNELELNQ